MVDKFLFFRSKRRLLVYTDGKIFIVKLCFIVRVAQFQLGLRLVEFAKQTLFPAQAQCKAARAKTATLRTCCFSSSVIATPSSAVRERSKQFPCLFIGMISSSMPLPSQYFPKFAASTLFFDNADLHAAERLKIFIVVTVVICPYVQGRIYIAHFKVGKQ